MLSTISAMISQNRCFAFCCEDMEKRASDHVHLCELRCGLPIVSCLCHENTEDRLDNVVSLDCGVRGVAGHSLPSSSARRIAAADQPVLARGREILQSNSGLLRWRARLRDRILAAGGIS
jgi:hypothetical protein